MSENIAARKVVEKTDAQIKNVSEKMSAAAQQTASAVEATYATAAESVKEYTLKLLEFAQVNSTSAFDYAQKLMAVRSPSEMMELSTAHASKQFELLTAQIQELSTLGQRMAADAAKPLSSGIAKAVHQAA